MGGLAFWVQDEVAGHCVLRPVGLDQVLEVGVPVLGLAAPFLAPRYPGVRLALGLDRDVCHDGGLRPVEPVGLALGRPREGDQVLAEHSRVRVAVGTD